MLPRLVVLVLALSTAGIGMVLGTWAVGGSDSSCYSLMAESFARGDLQPTSALASEAPWPDAQRTLAPGGFIPSPVTRDAASPICTPGFSLFLAPLHLAGGADAIFLLTPIAGGLVVWLTFQLGAQVAGAWAGVVAAVMVATTPVFVFQLVQPMNDIAATALWTAAVVLIARESSTGRPASSTTCGALGVITGAALLVRPNLMLAAGIVASWVIWTTRCDQTRRWRGPLLFVLAVTPFAIVVTALNQALYGHPLRFGYGSAADLFAVTHVSQNLANHGTALLQSQLGFPLLGLAAVMMLPLRRQPEIWVALGISATVAVTYLLYTPFREWWYLRFLLPALPMLTVLAVSALFVGVRRWWIVVPAAVAVVAWTTTSLEMRQALDLARIERRFRTTGELVRQRLPMNAVFITVFESGTVRYHAGAPAILWDSLDPAWLDRGLQWLTTRGFEPFIILEQWEEAAFRERFAAHSPIGQLDWPPRFEIVRQVRIFSPADRSRYLAGEQISPEFVWPDRQ